MFYTYILQSRKDKQFYTGYTDDMKERLKLRNTGKVASTKNYSKLENGRMNPTLFCPSVALLCPSEALCVGGCGGGRLWKKSLMRWEFQVANF